MSEEPIAFAVIGGTGLYKLAELDDAEAIVRGTPYGEPSGPARVGLLHGHRVAFLARHGEAHSLPPHRVNYRANLWLLKDIGVRRVVAVNAVGGITPDWAPCSLGLPDQLIDYTWGRVGTYCEEPGSEVQHVDMTDPYSPALRRELLACAADAGVDLVDGGCYAATQGPRLETRAEVARLRRDGCDVIGMTGMPEAALARELGLDYACLALVANWAAGCGGQDEITLEEVFANLDQATRPIPALLGALVERLG